MADETTNTESPQNEERPVPVDISGFRSEVEYLTKELAKVRQEAAKYRTERNEFREQIKGMTSIEEVQALQSQVKELELKATRDSLIMKYAAELPEALRSAVAWPDTEDAIKAKAEELSAFAQPNTGVTANPKGGLGDRGQGDGEEYDPAALVAGIPR